MPFKLTAAETLKLLCFQNKGLTTSIWRVYKAETKPAGLQLFLGVDADSETALNLVGLRPYLNLRRITFSKWVAGGKSGGK